MHIVSIIFIVIFILVIIAISIGVPVYYFVFDVKNAENIIDRKYIKNLIDYYPTQGDVDPQKTNFVETYTNCMNIYIPCYAKTTDGAIEDKFEIFFNDFIKDSTETETIAATDSIFLHFISHLLLIYSYKSKNYSETNKYILDIIGRFINEPKQLSDIFPFYIYKLYKKEPYEIKLDLFKLNNYNTFLFKDYGFSENNIVLYHSIVDFNYINSIYYIYPIICDEYIKYIHQLYNIIDNSIGIYKKSNSVLKIDSNYISENGIFVIPSIGFIKLITNDICFSMRAQMDPYYGFSSNTSNVKLGDYWMMQRNLIHKNNGEMANVSSIDGIISTSSTPYQYPENKDFSTNGNSAVFSFDNYGIVINKYDIDGNGIEELIVIKNDQITIYINIYTSLKQLYYGLSSNFYPFKEKTLVVDLNNKSCTSITSIDLLNFKIDDTYTLKSILDNASNRYTYYIEKDENPYILGYIVDKDEQNLTIDGTEYIFKYQQETRQYFVK